MRALYDICNLVTFNTRATKANRSIDVSLRSVFDKTKFLRPQQCQKYYLIIAAHFGLHCVSKTPHLTRDGNFVKF